MHNPTVLDLVGWPPLLVYRLMLAEYKASNGLSTVSQAMLNLSDWKSLGEPVTVCTLTVKEYRELYIVAKLANLADWHIDWLVSLLSQEKLNNGQA